MEMKYLKWIFVSFILVFSYNSVYAKTYTVHGQVLAQSHSGQYIPQYWKDRVIDGKLIKAPKYRVSIAGYPKTEEITQEGHFSFKLDRDKYPPGKEVTFSVNKKDSKIIYPLDGKTFLPASSEGRIKLVLDFKERKPVNIFAVQLLNTRDETKAIALKNDLAKDLLISKTEEWQKEPVYIEKYMVANMPDNGFDYKVKVGTFSEKGFAIEFKKYLERRYSKMQGLFITQKDLK